MSDTAKITLSLPSYLVAELDYISDRLGVSRSGLVTAVLAADVSEMRRLVDLVPISVEPLEHVRLRGQSADIVLERIAALRGVAHGLPLK